MFDNVDMRASFKLAYDLNGDVRIKAYSATGATRNTPYTIQIDEFGPFQEDLADSVEVYYVGVPDHTVLSAVADWFQIGGRITAMIIPSIDIAVGHALIMFDGVISDVGSDYGGIAGQFAVCRTASVNTLTVDCILVPERITGTT